MIKKISVFIATVLISFFGTWNVAFAQSFNLYFSGENAFPGNDTTLTLQLSGSANVGGSCGGICGITASLSYDTAKLELLSAAPSQGFDYTLGPAKLVLYKATAASDGTILTLHFNNKALGDGESTTISLSNITGTNGDAEFSASATQFTVRYSAPKPTEPTTPSSQPGTNNTSNSSTSPNHSSVNANSGQSDNTQENKNNEFNGSNTNVENNQKNTNKSSNNEAKDKKDEDIAVHSNIPIIATIIVLGIIIIVGLLIFLFLKKRKTKSLT